MVQQVLTTSRNLSENGSLRQSGSRNSATTSSGRSFSLLTKEPVTETPTCNIRISAAKVAMISLAVIALIAAGVVSGGAVPAALAFGAILVHSAWGIAAISTIGTIALANLGLITSFTAASRSAAYNPDSARATQKADSVTKTVENMTRRAPCIIPFVLGIGLAPAKVGFNILRWGFNEISYLRNKEDQTPPDSTSGDRQHSRALSRKGDSMGLEWIVSEHSRLQNPNFPSVAKQTTFMDVLSRGRDAVLQGVFFPTTLALATNKYLNRTPSSSSTTNEGIPERMSDLSSQAKTSLDSTSCHPTESLDQSSELLSIASISDGSLSITSSETARPSSEPISNSNSNGRPSTSKQAKNDLSTMSEWNQFINHLVKEDSLQQQILEAQQAVSATQQTQS